MKKYRKQFWMLIMVFTLSICLSIVVKAQPANPGQDVDAPIDGGVSLLVAAGIGLGIKKVKENRKRKSTKLM